MRGVAMTYESDLGISNTRQRFRTPSALSAGETARQMVFSVRVGSATTSLASRGSRPSSTHSTEA